MDAGVVRQALAAARAIEDAVPGTSLPPSESAAPDKQPVVPHSLFKGTRGYLERIAFQVNACYEAASYDACAVMIRRLIEVLIIETFDAKGKASDIKNASGDFLYLGDLIGKLLAETSWSLGRNTKTALPKLKSIGDQSAHSRRYNARREYIDEIIIDVRTVAEELLYLSGLK